MCSVPYLTRSEPLFKQRKILKLSDIYKLQINKYVLIFLKNQLSTSLNDLFTTSRETHGHATGHSISYKLIISKIRSNTGCRSILKKGPVFWNMLPSKLYTRTIATEEVLVSNSCFSSRFKRFILEQYGDQ